MTHQNAYTLPGELAEKGLEAVPELLRVLINNVMQAERSKYLQADQYERTEDRKGHSNGYKPKTVRTRMGEITFAVPQVREGGFYPTAQEKGLRSERALVTTLAEVYVQGVSTRKVKSYHRAAVRGLRSQPCRLAGQRPNWTQCCRSGEKDRWVKSPISMWMPVTRRYERLARCGMRLF